jgi:hypothetical protein
MSETVSCPACGKTLAVKGIPKHTNGCPKWSEVIGTPPSQFNFDRHFKRGLYVEGKLEGEDYVRCLLCPDHRAKRLADHLKLVHELTLAEYQALHPGALTSAKGSLRQRSATVLERYGVDNVARADEVRVLLRENSRAQEPLVVAKRKATNKTRYGHENPFGGEAIKQRIREVMTERYGAPSPQQVPEIFARTQQTIRDKHDGKHLFETEGYKARFKEVSLERFGTEHPMLSAEGLKRWIEGNQEKLGVPNPLLDPDIWQKSYQTNLVNHGGVHSQQCPEVLAKAQATWLEKYGVDNPSKAEEVKLHIKDVWMGKYGVPFPPQSLWTNRTQSFPNGLEKQFLTLCPVNVVYAGDGSYWVRASGESKARNPDFVVLDLDQLKAYQDGAKLNSLRTYRIIEMFGDYWHGPKVTGKDRETHKLEVVDYYRRAGITCLVLWESEVRKHPKRVAERLLGFLAG